MEPTCAESSTNIFKEYSIEIDDFLTYCEEELKVSRTTVYTYLNVAKLIDEFPSIILSGVSVSKIVQKKKKNKRCS
jgi:hypothetical protein